jgi:hypothetical protein
MTSQGLMPARNAGLSSHRPGKLNNSKWPLSKFSRAMTTKTSIPRGHQGCDVIMHKVYCNLPVCSSPKMAWHNRYDLGGLVSYLVYHVTTHPLAIQKQHWHLREAQIESPLTECEWAFRTQAYVFQQMLPLFVTNANFSKLSHFLSFWLTRRSWGKGPQLRLTKKRQPLWQNYMLITYLFVVIY